MLTKEMTATWVLIICLQGVVSGCQQGSQGLSPEAAAVLRYYLNVQCEAGEKKHKPSRKPLSDLRDIEKRLDEKGKTALKAKLERLLAEGPDREVEAEVVRDAKEEFVQEQAFFKADESMRTLGLKPEDLKILQSETQTDYVDAEFQRVKRIYKERAVIALHFIDKKSAEDALRRLDKRESVELEKVIHMALQPQTRQPSIGTFH